MAEAGLQKLYTYVSLYQNNVAQYIATRPIVDLCLATKRRPGPIVAMPWWEKEVMDLEGNADGGMGGGADIGGGGGGCYGY